MTRILALIAGLVAMLALLTWGAWAVVRTATLTWFDRDLTSRAAFAVTGARTALLSAWQTSTPNRLTQILDEVARDPRVESAAACDTQGTLPRAATAAFPRSVICSQLAPLMHTDGDDDWQTWSDRELLANGVAHVTATPVRADDGTVLGFVVIVHDVTDIAQREEATQRFLLAVFGVIAILTSLITATAGRVAWRRWSDALRRALWEGGDRPEFRFVMHDVRALAERIATERDLDRDVEAWTPQRLRDALTRQLERDQILIIANREPYIHDRLPNGDVRVIRPASGLVTALEPVMRACSGVWIAHGGGAADRETADAKGRLRVPPGDEAYTLRRVWLTPEEEQGYYYGFSNEGLWPLCHIAHNRPTFRTGDWKQYVEANRKFADAVADEAVTHSPIVLVQDYHFALLPRLIRARIPRATILMFWHIPWPNAEAFGICPQREALLDGMLGADILGFHTQADCNNFVETVERYVEARTDREVHALVMQGHRTFVRPYPISVAWPPPPGIAGAGGPDVRSDVRAELGLPGTQLLGLGVDRLDYTKGIEERLLAMERLLERFPEFRGRVTFVQLAAPSRTVIERYARLGRDVEALVTRINTQYGEPGRPAIVLRHAHHEQHEIYRYYRATDFCYVSSLHDGMNLVAKEFVAARDDDDGVLVLSQFTGAARELTEALIVNPYDIEQASEAIAVALRMAPADRRERMRRMRTHVAEFNVYRWAGRMLLDAARLRHVDALPGRLVGAGLLI